MTKYLYFWMVLLCSVQNNIYMANNKDVDKTIKLDPSTIDDFLLYYIIGVHQLGDPSWKNMSMLKQFLFWVIFDPEIKNTNNKKTSTNSINFRNNTVKFFKKEVRESQEKKFDAQWNKFFHNGRNKYIIKNITNADDQKEAYKYINFDKLMEDLLLKEDLWFLRKIIFFDHHNVKGLNNGINITENVKGKKVKISFNKYLLNNIQLFKQRPYDNKFSSQEHMMTMVSVFDNIFAQTDNSIGAFLIYPVSYLFKCKNDYEEKLFFVIWTNEWVSSTYLPLVALDIKLEALNNLFIPWTIEETHKIKECFLKYLFQWDKNFQSFNENLFTKYQSKYLIILLVQLLQKNLKHGLPDNLSHDVDSNNEDIYQKEEKFFTDYLMAILSMKNFNILALVILNIIIKTKINIFMMEDKNFKEDALISYDCHDKKEKFLFILTESIHWISYIMPLYLLNKKALISIDSPKKI